MMLYFDLGSEKIENENPDSPEPAEEAIDDNFEKEETAADKNEDKNEGKKEENEEDRKPSRNQLLREMRKVLPEASMLLYSVECSFKFLE